ncbi:hypothetical protein BDR05DRAFT_306014 [Suillus weaverae]|nr:hypothetical protein BDR05DRAFT_306014 [Suillus weaverae]
MATRSPMSQLLPRTPWTSKSSSGGSLKRNKLFRKARKPRCCWFDLSYPSGNDCTISSQLWCGVVTLTLAVGYLENGHSVRSAEAFLPAIRVCWVPPMTSTAPIAEYSFSSFKFEAIETVDTLTFSSRQPDRCSYLRPRENRRSAGDQY